MRCGSPVRTCFLPLACRVTICDIEQSWGSLVLPNTAPEPARQASCCPPQANPSAMPDQGPAPAARAGLSLYANLLDGGASSADQASISRAPVLSREALDAIKDQEAAASSSSAKRPAIDAALRFQPLHQIRRPQQKTQKPKAFPKTASTAPPTAAAAAAAGSIATTLSTTVSAVTPAVRIVPGGTPPAAVAATQKPTLADWQATQDEDAWVYGTGDKRPRGGRRKKKGGGGGRGGDAPAETDWNEIYDPSRPTNVDEYLRSDERVREVQEWKALLYRHRRQQQQQADPRRERRSGSWSSDEEMDDARPAAQNQQRPAAGSYNFAPPPMSPPRASIPDADNTGDDAYMRRLALSQGAPAPPRPTEIQPPPPPSPPPISLPPQPVGDNTATISRAPVRYTPSEQPPAPTLPPAGQQKDPDAMEEDGDDDQDGDVEQLRSNRPGQKGFAARLMAKYGWSKGQGLGAESSGILQPLKVQVEKRNKKAESGGGTAQQLPGGRGKIIAPKHASSSSATTATSQSAGPGSGPGKFGRTSNVIVLRDMLDGMQDLQSEMEHGLGQEIGEECGEQYGRVERLYIDVEGRRVYIKFTDGVSALRAVNALDGRVFAGNTIIPQFYDPDKFEQRVYE
ncbi:splicing factor 45 [Microdochium nivale]|nr:splicing factor 45 [Microdochium nivale]